MNVIQTDVAVICLVYNHEKFLRDCLEGFVNQHINFDYKVIVHDDFSTDGSRNLIREYEERYPDLIVPLYEEENQYSQGKNIIQDIILPLLDCKYIAICEGDDYWCNNNKILMQYDYMEKHKEVSLCTHNTRRHDLRGINQDFCFNKWVKEKKLSEREIFEGWYVHTSSYFFRNNAIIRPKEFSGYWFGDYVLLLNAYKSGDVAFLPEIMSVYNDNNTEGMGYRKCKGCFEDSIKNELLRIDFLREYNDFTKQNFNKIIKRKIFKVKLALLKACLINFVRNTRHIIIYKQVKDFI